MGAEAGLDSGVQGLTEGPLLEREGPGKAAAASGPPPPTGSTQSICTIPFPGQETGLQDPTHGGTQLRVEAGACLLPCPGPRGPRVSLKGPRQLSGELISTQRGESTADLHTGVSVCPRAHAHVGLCGPACAGAQRFRGCCDTNVSVGACGAPVGTSTWRRESVVWVRCVPSAGVGVSLGTAPSLVCAHTVARPRPQAHPVTLLISTLTAPQAVPRLYQAHGPLAAPHHSPQGTNAALRAPAPCSFSARNPPHKIPTQARARVSGLRSDFISP